MARHRSPRGRRAYLGPPPSEQSSAAGAGAHRSAPVTLRRSAAVAAATGGALVLAVQAVQSTGWQPSEANAALGVDSGSSRTASAGQPATSPVVLAGQRLAAAPESTDPLPEQLDVAALVKAVGLDQLSKAAAAAPPAPACKPNNAGFGRVKAWVATAGYEIRCTFGVSTVFGVGSRGEVSDHPLGLALDFMVNRTTGDALANFALQNMDRLSIKYVIWRQRINYGSGWQGMEDRGGVTANHYDHVHISFDSTP